MKLSALVSAVAPSRLLSAITSSIPAASAFLTMPSSTLAQKLMPRSRLAKASTYLSPFFGGDAFIASTTAAASASAESMSPEKPVGVKPWKSWAGATAVISARAAPDRSIRTADKRMDSSSHVKPTIKLVRPIRLSAP